MAGKEGTDGRTLARRAERAGGSKTVAYDHFRRRIDLLPNSRGDAGITAGRTGLDDL